MKTLDNLKQTFKRYIFDFKISKIEQLIWDDKL